MLSYALFVNVNTETPFDFGSKYTIPGLPLYQVLSLQYAFTAEVFEESK